LTEKNLQFETQITRRAFELAALSVGQVSPNPLVGCVIVAEDGEIVGEGTYIFDDVIHAEAIALAQAGERSRGGTAYVSLEPHDHQGKTSPCSVALINAGIKRVVCSLEDPNPLVSGLGFKRLRENGVEVVNDILVEEAAKLNEKFVCWHQKKRPFIHLKMAMSIDGRISIDRSVSTTLSGKDSAKKVQELRHEYDAILVGGNTSKVDNPSLTDRSSRKRRRKLVRVILDNRLQIPVDSVLAETANETPTIVFSNSNDREKIEKLTKKGVEIISIDARNLSEVLQQLRIREIQSVLVEGGTAIGGAFFDAKLIDKVTFFMAPIIIGGNAPNAIGGNGATEMAEAMKLQNVEIQQFGDDFMVTGYPNRRMKDEG
jgi:diaminohydroxyphosphoribosylaminopyrimidine deaminase / 5-amino-6-(5-phosphoribosylamino)uracil reductase